MVQPDAIWKRSDGLFFFQVKKGYNGRLWEM